jgi:hypothetical protein
LIWLTWRQSQLKAASAGIVLAVFAVLLAVTGPQLAHSYASSTLAACHGGVDDCGGFADDFLQALSGSGWRVIGGDGIFWLLQLLGIAIIVLAPAVIGIFWGAPLIAGELEAGTHYLVWNQSVTRTRWLALKLLLTGLAAMAFTELVSIIQTWWASPINLAVARGACCSLMAMNQFSPLIFATQGITPLGYAAFAFALGVTAGLLVRRAVPAMAVTLAVFALFQAVVPLWIRPVLFPPYHTTTTFASFGAVDVPIEPGTFTIVPSGFDQTEAWVLSTAAVDTAGRPVNAMPAACLQAVQGAVAGKSGHSALLDCLSSQGVRIAVTYQPASRYWALQWTETGIYTALALILVGYCFWRVRERVI